MYMYVFAEICMYTMYVKGLPFFLALFQLFFQYYQIVMSGQFRTLAMFMMASLFLSLKQVNVDVDFVSHICFVRNDAHTVVQPGHCLGEFFCPSGAQRRWGMSALCSLAIALHLLHQCAPLSPLAWLCLPSQWDV